MNNNIEFLLKQFKLNQGAFILFTTKSVGIMLIQLLLTQKLISY